MVLASVLSGLVAAQPPDVSAPVVLRLTPRWPQSPYNGPSASFVPVVTPTPTAAPTRAPKASETARGLPTVAEAKAYALARLGPVQFACLVDIVSHEDGTWDPHRLNRQSGAYGIPQALPGSKMASAGADWRSNRITQLRWMLAYIAGRYGSACAAATFRRVHGWY